jgi:hypothetical protein
MNLAILCWFRVELSLEWLGNWAMNNRKSLMKWMRLKFSGEIWIIFVGSLTKLSNNKHSWVKGFKAIEF